jgi:hypothetical protein
VDKLVIVMEPFQDALDAKAKADPNFALSDTYDEAKPTKRQQAVRQLWGIPIQPLVDQNEGVVGSLQIRKVGAIDVYALRLADMGGYTAPLVVEQFASARPISGSAWGEVGQVKIVFTLRGGVVTRSCTSAYGFRSIELGSSSIYKGEVAPTLAPHGHLGFNPKRIVGLGGVVLRPHFGEDLEEGLEKGESITSLGNFLRESQDGRALAAVIKGAMFDRLFCLVLIMALLRDLVLREVDEVKAKIVAAAKKA